MPRPATPLACLYSLLLALAALALPACHAGNPTPAPTPTLNAADYAPAFDAAVGELRRMGFRVQRQDYRMGVIDTDPLDVPTAFEPWRYKSPTAGIRSSLNHLRRQAVVRLTPIEDETSEPDDPPQYRLHVEVELYRHQAVNRQITATASRNIFNNLDDTPAELRRRGIDGSYWEPIGREPALENRLVRRILRQLEQQL